MSKTPRTDAGAFWSHDEGGEFVHSELARQLEQENAEMRSHLAALVAYIDGEQMYPNDDALSSARALLARVSE